MNPAEGVCEALRASRGVAHKRDISSVLARLGPGLDPRVKVGDDCAALPDGDGYLLFAMEGFVEDFVERMPWFAGYCGVMVNVSDIYAMGGRPRAVVDTVWSDGDTTASPVLDGLAEAARKYAVPVVGGHSNKRSARGQLAVAILGRASRLLTSFDARPGDLLLAAVDLRGQWREPFPYWDASTTAPAERLRADLEILPGLAEDGLCAAAKDISMAGVVGTTLMLMECSGTGARIDIDRLPRPPGLALDDPDAMRRWLAAFPSFGFVLSVPPQAVAEVRRRFNSREIACEVFGEVRGGGLVELAHRGHTAPLWDFTSAPLILADAGGGEGA